MAKALKYSEIKDLEVKEIDLRIKQLQKGLMGFHLGDPGSDVKSHEVTILKKNIARLLTAKNRKKEL